MRKPIKLILVALLLVLAFGITACGKKVEDSASSSSTEPISADDLIGSWKGTGNEISTVTFKQDGSYRDDAGDVYISGTYEVDVFARTITIHENEYGMTFTYDFNLSGDNLTMQLSGGLERTFTKANN